MSTTPGVVVLGMHRSGTSAVAGALRHLGLRLPDESFLLRPRPDNPRGYFEVRPLVVLNQRLLRALGGDWSAPPPLEPGWEAGPAPSALAEEAGRTFTTVMPASSWLWKDPRNCITLPFWLNVLGVRPAAVVVLRDPGEVARSLRERDAFTESLGLALWERYTRDLLDNLAGLPVVVARFERILSDPPASIRSIGEGLAALGAPVGAMDEQAVADLVSREIPSSREEAPVEARAEQHVLAEVVESLEPVYETFPSLELGELSESARSLVEARRRELASVPWWRRKARGAGRTIAGLMRRR